MVVLALVGPHLLPFAFAQVPTGRADLPVRPDGSRPASEGEYVSDVQGRVALKQHLEARYNDEATRQAKLREYVQALQTAQPPAGADPAAFERFRQSEIQQAQALIQRSERASNPLFTRLKSVSNEILNDQDWIKRNPDRGVSQELGPLIGTAGAAFVPVAGRPTIGKSMAAGAQATRVTNQAKLSEQILKLFQTRDASIAKLSTVQPPATRTQWITEVGSGGNLQLRNGTQVIDLKEPAQIKSGNGQMIRNEAGWQKAQQMLDLQSSRASVEAAKQQLQFEKSRASDTATVKKLDKQIAELDAKKAKLSTEIDEHNGKNPKQGSTMGNLLGSAAKWAAFSAGMTVATNVVQQLTRNGWDPHTIDWKSAIQPLKTAEFWGGTAGSFGVSMLAAMIPGGSFIKTFAAIGGAAVGWQLGTGNLMSTDWLQLGVSTLGATIGTILGSSIGGPIGGFIGGIAGQMLANWGLKKLREYLENSSDSHVTEGREAYQGQRDPYQNLSAYTGRPVPPPTTAPSRPAPGPAATEYNMSNLGDLRREMNSAYQELETLTRGGGDPYRVQQLRERIQALNNRLQQLRNEGPRDERENVRE